MELIQRIGCKNDSEEFKKYAEEYLSALKRHKKCCDTAWLATLYGYPQRDTHRKYAEILKPVADKFRKTGINISLQLSNTIGHGEYISYLDCSGLVYDDSPAENFVGWDGTTLKHCFCWNGENFRRYILDTITFYCDIKPDVVWFDDDLTARNFDPETFGCFCDNCINKFNTRFGYDFTREELVEKILHGDIGYREKWIDFVRAGLYDFTFAVCRRIHELSPTTKIGYEYCAYGAYMGYGFDYIFKAMKDATGFDPLSRPGSGVYSDQDPNAFINSAFMINWCNSTLPDYVKNKTPEIENLPHVAFQKTPAGTVFQTSLYFAYGNTDMSYSDMMAINDIPYYYDELFDGFSKNRDYWEKVSEYNKFSTQAGIRFFMSVNIWRKKLEENEGFVVLNAENWYSALAFARDAIPIAFDKEETSVVLLHPDTAKVLSDEEIAFLLTKNVITDGETLTLLKDRIDFGIDVEPLENSEIGKRGIEFLPHITRPNGLKRWQYDGFTFGKTESYRLIVKNAAAERLAVYYDSVTGELYPDADFPYTAETIVKTGKGGTWAILAYQPWKGVISSLRRDQLLNIADHISGDGLPARLYSITPFVLAPRKDENGKTVCVSVANVSIGKSCKTELLIRHPRSEKFRFMAMNGEKTDLLFKKIDGGCLITLPTMDAFTVGTVFCE